MPNGVIHSSHGELTVDMGSGNVIECEETGDPGSLSDIARFDFDEYFKHYSSESRADVNDFDILDVGFWTKAGVYVAAEPDFRSEVAMHTAAHGGDLIGLTIPGAVASMLKGAQ